jgi:uncharacterized repeat protein (TIGR03803 family)
MKTNGSVFLRESWVTGLAIALALLLGRQPIQAQTYSEVVLHNFTGAGDGAIPEANLLLIGSYLNGTTTYGGTFGYGTVFKVSTTGQTTVLYSFTGGTDGAGSGGGLIKDAKRNLYGGAGGGAYGGGVLFKLSPSSQESVLYSFGASSSDGSGPGTLVMDSAGNFYGVALGGGVSGCYENGWSGCGTIFKVTATGEETTLYSFCSQVNCSDGAHPDGVLIMDGQGTLYGTTFYGGAFSGGTVFKLDPATGVETVLYSFAGGSDGQGPLGGVLLDSAGNLFGTTLHGGGSTFSGCAANGYVGCGTVFELNTTGKETVLYSFCSQASCTDGAGPCARLIKDGKGNFYSTTYNGGTYNAGTVFTLNKKTHKESVLYSFTNGADGANPHGSLVRNWVGKLFGTTMYGGTYGAGTVFELTP